ncbi:elongator complex protein 2 [Daktulosphaira vitifoliae]|uniref:elongator complex protein 2 n=1 Tax=Daktulosphaira vitifoliae TaxID=58002 RepID=UPI0021AAF6B8|nr:elongator complex protein 2 [Daktulosphaira vitifoliae]
MSKEESIKDEIVTPVYVSCSINSTPHCLDWGPNGLVIFGSSHAVHMYDPCINDDCDGKIISTFLNHTKRVNSVKWVQHMCNDQITQDFVSCSADNTAVLWEGVQPSGFYRHNEKLIGHTDVVTSSDALRLSNNTFYIATASGDCTVRAWIKIKNSNSSQCFQTIEFDNILCLSLKITSLPLTNSLLLACGLSNSKIQLYLNDFSKETSFFIPNHVLEGHEDWVRTLDFIFEDVGLLFLASGSQDSMIRLWKFSIEENIQHSSYEYSKETLQLERKKMIIEKNDGSNLTYIIQTETVISGHDSWIYGVNWKSKNVSDSKLELLSVSMDKTLAVWSLDDESGLWIDFVRLGEVGGNTLGFYGAKFSPDGQCILAQGHNGSFHLWKKSNENKLWSPAVTIGGHFGSVEDLAWDPEGKYIISVSCDQTTRIHGQWLKSSKSVIDSNWHELARPQVHGYNMSSVAILSSLSFVSSSEEKVIRVFQGSYNFIENMNNLAKVQFPSCGITKLSLGASVPSLGLSNKAVSENECQNKADKKKKNYPEHYFVPLALKQPPTEEDLVQNTLWPEIQKLYGHGYEVYCLASSPNGKWIASAAKATSIEHAAIIIWSVEDFLLLQKLESHNLTITQLAFSPDSTKLLSVSRDRTWSLFEYSTDLCIFNLVFKSNKHNGIHTRIIWCCAWSHDSFYFSTGSRDGKLVIWSKFDEYEPNMDLNQLYRAKTEPLLIPEESITSMDFAPMYIYNKSYLIALGCDSGRIFLFKWSSIEEKTIIPWYKISEYYGEFGHHLTVKKIKFQPTLSKKNFKCDENILQIASCGADMMVRIYNINISNLTKSK